MKKSEFKALLKEEIKRVLTENMFEVGDEVMYMGEPHRVFSDNGYVIKLVSKKRGTKVTLNYSQAKEKISKQTDYMNENDFDQKSVNYTPGGWTPDKVEYWRSLPPGKYEVTYKPMLPLDAVKTYTLDFPEGKEFESYDEARRFYFSNQPMWFKIEDRMKNLVKVKQIETYNK